MVEYDKLIADILREITEISESAAFPDGFLELQEVEKGHSLWIIEPVSNRRSKMIFSVTTRGKVKQKYISLSVKLSVLGKVEIPATADIVKMETEAPNCRINFQNGESEIIPYLHDLIIYYVEHFEPSDKFGCCHRYKECSEEKKCLHPDQFYAKACWYRKNLEAGNIFY